LRPENGGVRGRGEEKEVGSFRPLFFSEVAFVGHGVRRERKGKRMVAIKYAEGGNEGFRRTEESTRGA